MQMQSETLQPFNLSIDFNDPVRNGLFTVLKGPIEHFLAFPRMNRAYADIAQMSDSRPFPEKVLERLNISYDLAEQDTERLMVPTGPAIVIANHPFGGIEGIILASLLRSLRCDVKFMANYLLNAIPEMREFLISVNPFKGGQSVRDNIRPLRESIQWLKNGGMLAVFPAGEVSHFDMQQGAVTDPAWSPTIARIIRKTAVPVLPMFFQGTNSAVFHMAGMVHPVLRTALLPNELFNKDREIIQVRVGDLIPPARLVSFEHDKDLITYLRIRTYALGERGAQVGKSKALSLLKMKRVVEKAIICPQNAAVMASEIRSLSPSQTLVESNEYAVIHAISEQIPHVLLEIGRLRETTFRMVGEGTGKAVDLDFFDNTYTHLFIWNRKTREIVGAYRLGRTDELMRRKGARGLYTNTLFHYRSGFFERLGPALELGRSFVRTEYQKSFAPLLLLWRGIGRFVVENPHYKALFGPVSISDEYRTLSRQLLVRYLNATRCRHDMAQYVVPKKAFTARRLKGWDIDAIVRLLKNDIEALSELISSLEPDNKGMPILLKQYLKLGGKIAGFNVDAAFGNVVDGLIIVDLTKTEPKILGRYLGKDGSRQFLLYHEGLHQERQATHA